jgi:hypothetical protein
MKLKNFTLLSFALIAGFITLNSSSGGVTSPDLTGSPQGGNANCTQCHTGTASNSSVIIMVKDFATGVPVSQYELGQTYTIDIILSDASNPPATGFQSTIYTGASTAHPGTLTANTGSKIQGSFATHTSKTSATVSSSTYKWSYNWTAPLTTTATVNIHASCNSANNDMNSTGDDIYTGSLSLQQKVTPASIHESDELKNAVQLYPNPAVNDLQVQIQNGFNGINQYRIMDLFGRVVLTHQSASAKTAISLDGLASGQYILMISQGTEVAMKSFSKQ